VARIAEDLLLLLLDNAAAGHAAIWLLDHGLADGDTVGEFITPAVMRILVCCSSFTRAKT